LGASRTLRAEDAARGLVALLGEMTRTLPPTMGFASAISEADGALTRIFELGRSGSPLEASVIAQGTELVVDAVSRADIRAWLDVVWRFDDMTHQHCLLVAGLAAGFARQLSLRPLDCRQLTQAALLHDLGKSRIPLTILNKPDKLDAHELAVMRTHSELGHRMLRDQGYPDAMLAVVRSHHEALDGSGYPDGLRSDRIPDLVRLITVCDVFAALIERRPYRRPLGGEEAYDILKGMDGKVDPDFVRAFQPLAEAADGAMIAAA
ncbi:MAG: HD domain-containing protein, partial [Oxalobacteraceae bacterium]